MDYPLKKPSNKVFNVVLWLQIFRRCKNLGSSSGNGSSSLRKPSSFPLEEKASAIIPRGCFSLLVGEVQKRFTVPTKFLGHPLFRELLREAEEEFGFHQKGVLRIPCDVIVFEHVLEMIAKKKGQKLEKRGRFECRLQRLLFRFVSRSTEHVLLPDYEADTMLRPSAMNITL
ncbi:hypothetical protein MLD38_006428 [Melastoma candidum]|uniref:Uncharacterized protein n=1 Tax=Melastoma candidum TaxID=119954 RepID=A0ACB9RND5_9MYRT|nr:hypothetical protein MLD38_006428 [Melastoma candidum]